MDFGDRTSQTTLDRRAAKSVRANGETNKLDALDRPAHDWYRFVLSYPPYLVREYLHRFIINQQQCVLDQ